MKYFGKIIWILFFSSLVFSAKSQNESPLQPFSNPMLINPAFAGFDNQTSLHVGNQFYNVDSAQAYNQLHFTYDTWSQKLNGGISIIFQQGIIGKRNISTTELGFSYAARPRKTENGALRFAVSTNFVLATKQLYVNSLDGIMIDAESSPNPPGPDLFQYLLLKPRLAVLYESRTTSWGLTAGFPLKVDFAGGEEDLNKVTPINLTLYISGNHEGYKKGLRTKPYAFIPEVIVFYQEDFSVIRLHPYMEHADNTLGIFLQSDITNNIHCLGGTAGIAFGNFRIDLNAGAGIPGISDQIGLMGELNLKIIVPRIDYSKINPWATERN
ncbi:type IX secretion system membrane protein PorP/SprF [Maribellus mangrovi]|uniref:type IX secretion system membrane protein PorP/SprF n=1 Tax=Maribellus mangrovi TaxID=3133146 RepID=UPI0030EBEE0C